MSYYSSPFQTIEVCKKFFWAAIKNYEANPITQYKNMTEIESQVFKVELEGFVTTWYGTKHIVDSSNHFMFFPGASDYIQMVIVLKVFHTSKCFCFEPIQVPYRSMWTSKCPWEIKKKAWNKTWVHYLVKHSET